MVNERKPLNVKVGDKVTSKTLREHGLVRETPLHKGKRSWTVAELNIGQTTQMRTGKKRSKVPKIIGITRIVLEAKIDGKIVRTRTFWYH